MTRSWQAIHELRLPWSVERISTTSFGKSARHEGRPSGPASWRHPSCGSTQRRFCAPDSRGGSVCRQPRRRFEGRCVFSPRAHFNLAVSPELPRPRKREWGFLQTTGDAPMGRNLTDYSPLSFREGIFGELAQFRHLLCHGHLITVHGDLQPRLFDAGDDAARRRRGARRGPRISAGACAGSPRGAPSQESPSVRVSNRSEALSDTWHTASQMELAPTPRVITALMGLPVWSRPTEGEASGVAGW